MTLVEFKHDTTLIQVANRHDFTGINYFLKSPTLQKNFNFLIKDTDEKSHDITYNPQNPLYKNAVIDVTF